MTAQIVIAPDGITRAAAALADGQLVALPTETVYGLGAKALDARACASIFEAKGRPLSDPLIVHLPDSGWLERLAVPDSISLALAEAFWPGPLTLVLPKSPVVPDVATAGQPTVAVRVSSHPVFSSTIQALGEPIAAPSANRFGRISPTSAAHVFEELGDRIPLILDGGECLHGIESTIVMVRDRKLTILRPGPITRRQLEAFAGVAEADKGVAVPGHMKSHYAPATKVIFDPAGSRRERCGLLAWNRPEEGYAACEVLSMSGDSIEAATRLYGAMRRLDALALDAIVAQLPPAGGLGEAIADRLKKAAG